MIKQSTMTKGYIAGDSKTTMAIHPDGNTKLVLFKNGIQKFVGITPNGKKWAIFPPEVWDIGGVKKSYPKAYVVDEYCCECKKVTNDQGKCPDIDCMMYF